MKFAELLTTVGDMPTFETGLLLAGNVNPSHIQQQLSRWTSAGKLIQLRRGLYALTAPYVKRKAHPFAIANQLVRGSYVSLQTALAHYSLIPEYVATITSIAPTRPAHWETPLGHYTYQRIKATLLYGYQHVALVDGQHAFVATPEKALLDLVYLQPGGDAEPYLNQLRLQNLETLNIPTLRQFAERANSPKLQRATAIITKLMTQESEGYETL